LTKDIQLAGKQNKRLLIRTDASTDIGVGHVMRCIALAQAWLDSGGQADFALARGADELGNRLHAEKMRISKVGAIPGSQEDLRETVDLAAAQRVEWLVLDGYHFSMDYRQQLENQNLHLLFIDDHGNYAPYRSEIVLNVNPQASGAMYGFSDSRPGFLLGTRYALLRREFLLFPRSSVEVPEKAHRILVTFGGSDSDNVTLQVLQALEEITDLKLQITIVVGATNPNKPSLQAQVAGSCHAATLLSDVNNMPQVMSQSDLAITAGGATCQELAFMEVPMFLLTIADNHEETVEAYSRAQAAVSVGWFNRIDRKNLVNSLRQVIADKKVRVEIRSNARRMVDGRGAQRVVEAMCFPKFQASRSNGPMSPVPHRSRWELGSEFHWMGLPQPPFLDWPKAANGYLLARHAIADLLRARIVKGNALWLPTYFCPEVAESCHDICTIREYRDSPDWNEPDWESLRPSPGDVVLAVNYFGVRSGEPWDRWRQTSNCVLLEDHSQDPFSTWALHSNADFAVVSARKTLPIADGALLWSPIGKQLPPQPKDGDWNGVALKTAAMMLKAEYLQGEGDGRLKAVFRDFQLRGEQMMRASRMSAISPPSFAYLADGVPESWRKQRSKNARYLSGRLDQLGHTNLLFNDWPEDVVPFAIPIVFSTQQERNECQSSLQKRDIYCPVHWVVQTLDQGALSLSERILSLPVDQRYSEADMNRIVEVLASDRAEQAAEAGNR